MSPVDYSDVTEAHGTAITREALDMMWTRYAFAAEMSVGRDVLEVACGAGQGLGYLARHARRVVGADCTARLLDMACVEYRGEVPLVRLDAQRLPFRMGSFDVVILYEALYYLPAADMFFRECRRVLRPGGSVVLSTVNREWPDFNPSPFSTRYWSADELDRLLREQGFAPRLLGAFPSTPASATGRLTSALKRFAVRWRLIPKTMRGKRLLKRVFLGKLFAFPRRLGETTATRHELVPLDGARATSPFKILFAVARLP